MTNCCDDYGQCQHAHGCPCGPATVPPFWLHPRSCEQLGICHRPARECPSGCEMTAPGVFETQAPKLRIWTVVALIGISAGVIYGAGRWAWANFGEQISAFFWAAFSLV